MYPLLMQPAFKDYLWGGTRLKTEYSKPSELAIVAESWEISCHPDGPSTVRNGPLAGRPLPALLREHPEWMGAACAGMDEFPLLIKLIDAQQDLSCQVHPADAYARRAEGQLGKNEMWYVIDAAPGAALVLGLEGTPSRDELGRRIADGTLMEVVHSVPVKAGDCYCIPAGLLHAIGAGILIAEIQQNSNVTYRVFDYGRRDKNGNLRELHIDKALDVIDSALRPIPAAAMTPENWPWFRTQLLRVDGAAQPLHCTDESFHCLLAVTGEAVLHCGEDLPLPKGTSVFLPAGIGAYTLSGRGDVLCTAMR